MAGARYDQETVEFLASLYEASKKAKLNYITNELLLSTLIVNGKFKISKFFNKKAKQQDIVDALNKNAQDFMKAIEHTDESDRNYKLDVGYSVSIAQGIKVNFNYVTNLVMKEAARVANNRKEKVSIELIMYSFFWCKPMPDALSKLLQSTGISKAEALKEFSYENYDIENFIPKDLRSFVVAVNPVKVRNQEKVILYRDREIESVWDILSKQEKSNVVLLGEAGVGKTAIFEEIAREIINEDGAPARFKGYKLVTLDVTALVAGTKYRGTAEERYELFKNFLEAHQKLIVFIDEMHMMLGAGKAEGASIDIANALKPVLAKNVTKVIGATTLGEFKAYVEDRDPAFARRFGQVTVREPNTDETFKMVKKTVENLSKYHGVTISDSLVKDLIIMSALGNSKNHNPDRTIDAVDTILAEARSENKTSINKKMILSHYGAYTKFYREASEKEKLIVANKIAAQYLYFTGSKKLTANEEVIGLSVILTKNASGQMIKQERIDSTYTITRKSIIDKMAYLYSGIEAENLISKDGVLSDYQDITEITREAERAIKVFALFSDPNNNKVFLENVKDETPKTKKFLNDEIDLIMKEAKEVAITFVNENNEKIAKCAMILSQRKFLTKGQLTALS